MRRSSRPRCRQVLETGSMNRTFHSVKTISTMKSYLIRRCLLRATFVGAALLAVSPDLFADAARSSRPNFVLIIGDDISVDDFGCYGHPSIRTPNIDQLADGGLRFTNAYLTTSQCSPTRCSVITGRYPHNTGAPELHTDLPEGQATFPQVLKDAGYFVSAAGKWHMGEYVKQPFDEVVDSKPGGEELWVEILQRRPKEQPFFMWFASHDAHRGWTPDPDSARHKPEAAVIEPYMIDTPRVREDMAKYYDEIQRLDRYVGLVVKELRDQGVLDNTCILFMADNGRPFARCKTRLYDSGVKTPLVIHWPAGVQIKSSVCHSLVSVIDIAPTILEMAGLKPLRAFQGISMGPLLANPGASIRKYVFAEHNWHGQIAHERMVRYGEYVYIRNAHPQLPQICGLDAQCPQKELRELASQGKLTPAQLDPLLEPRPAEEFFDVSQDSHQIQNLIGDTCYRDTVEHLRGILDEWQNRTGDTIPPLDRATPDRYDRRTGAPIHGRSGRPAGGIVPGQETVAARINDAGPR